MASWPFFVYIPPFPAPAETCTYGPQDYRCDASQALIPHTLFFVRLRTSTHHTWFPRGRLFFYLMFSRVPMGGLGPMIMSSALVGGGLMNQLAKDGIWRKLLLVTRTGWLSPRPRLALLRWSGGADTVQIARCRYQTRERPSNTVLDCQLASLFSATCDAFRIFGGTCRGNPTYLLPCRLCASHPKIGRHMGARKSGTA